MTPFLFTIAAATSVVFASGGLVEPLPAQIIDTPIAEPMQSPPAPTSISADVMVLHGTNDGSGIDPKIGSLPALSKPPLSAYNSYRLLDQTKLALAKGKGSSYKLPTGRDLSIVYKEVIEPSKKGEPRKFVITASIQKPDGKTFLPLLEVNAKPGEWFFVGGQDYKGGGLVVGIKISP